MAHICQFKYIPASYILKMPALSKVDLGLSKLPDVRMVEDGEYNDDRHGVGGFVVIDDIFKAVGGPGHNWNGRGFRVKYINLPGEFHVAAIDPWHLHRLFGLNGDAAMLGMSIEQVEYTLPLIYDVIIFITVY